MELNINDNENSIKEKLIVKRTIYFVVNLFRFSLLLARFYIARSKSRIPFHIFRL